MSIISEEEADDRVPDPRDNAISSSSSHSDDQSSHSSDDESSSEEEGLPLPPFTQHTFAPPFYGRPPTPLPPSPSLTSLLRPSRPTTPDASDDDGLAGHGSTTGGPTSHGEQPVPRASPKVPTYEYYGFALYLFSGLSFLIYLLWSYLPSPFLHALGIYYYPNRWWSVAIPSWIVILAVYIYVALAAYNVEIMTLSPESIETIVDEAARVAVVDAKGRIVRDKEREKDKGGGKDKGGRERRRNEKERERERERRRGDGVVKPGGGLNWREVWNEGTDAIMDVPVGGVCEVLYGGDADGGGVDWEGEGEEDGGLITRL